MTIIGRHHVHKNTDTTIDGILERNLPRMVLQIEGHTIRSERLAVPNQSPTGSADATAEPYEMSA